MRVFVGIDMRDDNAGGLKLANLGGGFGGDFAGIHATGNRARGEYRHAVSKVRIDRKRGKLFCSKDRPSVGEHNMAADTQFRNCLCQLRRFHEGRTVGHERRRSNHAARVSLHDGAVYARSVAEIICVDDQAPHAASLAVARA